MFAKCIPRRPWRFTTQSLVNSSPRRSIYRSWVPRHGIDIQNRSISIESKSKRPVTTRPRHGDLNLKSPFISRPGTRTRTLFTTSIPPLLIPPTIFISLLLALWTWKCFWIVVMQDKLLYLSWLPPLSRSEEMNDYKGEFRGVRWTEKEIGSLDGTGLVVCEGRLPFSLPVDVDVKGDRGRGGGGSGSGSMGKGRRRRVVICYFQGNGGSTPMRLPLLSQTLRAIGEYGNANPHSDSGQPGNEQAQTEYILAALSYRGYWKSKGRATQTGIELDAQAFLDWVYETYQHPNMDMDTRIVLWGHSLGAAVASSAVAKRLSRSNSAEEALETASTQPPISGLILEAPISSIKDMLISLYPQKWLPYRYLWPLSWNTWDVADSLEKLGQHKNKASQSHSEFNLSANANSHHGHVPPILLMSAASDEVIPTWVADQLVDKARHHRLDIQRTDVKGAMHIEGPLKAEGKKALVEFIVNSSARSGPGPT